MKQQQPPPSPFPYTRPSLACLTHFTTQGLPTVIAKKVAGIVEELNSDTVSVASLRAYLAVGIPDEAALIREYCWKVVLGYLPPEKSRWAATVEREARTYEGLVKLFLPAEKFEDYPLALKKQHPRYAELEEDFLLWEQIEKDTSRTHAEFSFFAAAASPMLVPYLTSARREKFRVIYGEDEQLYQQFLGEKERQRRTYRYDYMSRILYVYSKLNPKIQYVQGMNEILAPIFYLVNANKPPHALDEPACFLMFNHAISEVLELHIKDLDKSKNGIYGKLQEVNQMLMVIDQPLWQRLDALRIDPFYYCFRWVTLLYAQDFALFDTIRIWESIFAADDRCLYINLFAIAIILSCREVILNHEFSLVLETLHNIRDTLNIHAAIAIADSLYNHHRQTNFAQEAARARALLEKQQEKTAKKEKEESEREGEGEKERRKAAKEKQKMEKQVERQKKSIKQEPVLSKKQEVQQEAQQAQVKRQKKKKKRARREEKEEVKEQPPEVKQEEQGKVAEVKQQRKGLLSKLAGWLGK